MTGFFTGPTMPVTAPLRTDTKNPDYAKKAKEALLLLDYGTVTGKTDSALALGKAMRLPMT